MKRFFVFIFAMIFSILSVQASENVILPSETGIVEEVEYFDTELNEVNQTLQRVQIKVSSGEHKGELIETDNMLTGNPYYDIKLKKGMKVVLHVEDNDGVLNYSVEDIKRSGVLVFLSLLFCGLLVYVGRKKGICSLAAIAVTCLLIVKGLAPMILMGVNPVAAVLIICLISTALTMYLVGGFNKKSTSAIIGCILSLAAAGVLAGIVVKTACLTGFTGETSMFLYSAHPELNFPAVVVSAMLLATLGAVMDVGISVASTINEIYIVDRTKTVRELFACGMNVGRDIIGTMANTLILVYIGGSLPLLLLASNIDMQKFINLNQVVTEISSALTGSIAIVLCVPVTAFVASELVTKIKDKFEFPKQED